MPFEQTMRRCSKRAGSSTFPDGASRSRGLCVVCEIGGVVAPAAHNSAAAQSIVEASRGPTLSCDTRGLRTFNGQLQRNAAVSPAAARRTEPHKDGVLETEFYR